MLHSALRYGKPQLIQGNKNHYVMRAFFLLMYVPCSRLDPLQLCPTNNHCVHMCMQRTYLEEVDKDAQERLAHHRGVEARPALPGLVRAAALVERQAAL
jgi:hypothetical protein